MVVTVVVVVVGQSKNHVHRVNFYSIAWNQKEYEIARELIKYYKFDIEKPDKEGYTPLMIGKKI